MKKAMWMLVAIALVCASTTVWAGGRPDKPYKNWFGHVGTGYVFVQGDTSDFLDDDWYLHGGATYWPSEWPVGVEIDLGYSNLGISRQTIDRINDIISQDPNNNGTVDGGDFDVWQLTFNGVWGPGKTDGTGFFVTGGVGVYYLEGTLNERGLVYYPPYCDPWWPWYCYPGGVGEGKFIRAKETTTEFGWNAGVGFGLEVGASGSQLVFEARYHDVSTNGVSLTYVPVTVAYRW